MIYFASSKGEAALKTIVCDVPGKEKDIEVLEIDVCDDSSVLKSAKTLRDRNIKLYGLVNNAGVLRAEDEVIMNTNYDGPKRVTDAFVDLMDRNEGRIVNISGQPMGGWLRTQVKVLKCTKEMQYIKLCFS